MCAMARLLGLVLVFWCASNVLSDEGDSQDRFVTSLIHHLNHVPERNYLYEEGILVSAHKKSDNVYEVEANVKAVDPNDAQRYKLLKCHGELVESGDAGQLAVSDNSSGCQEEASPPTEVQLTTDPGDTQVVEGGETEAASEEVRSVEDVQVTTEAELESHAVKLDHEVLPSNQATSGEQFVAVRRERTGPCAGCSSLVSTAAAGVPELALLAVRHVDRHEPDVAHRLNRVLAVERQVQVVNGVRYILTLDVDYDTCSADNTEGCLQTKTCRVSILEKPWLKLPDGTKFRAIVSNNCTSEYLFGDNGEVLPTITETSGERDNEIDVHFNPDDRDGGGRTAPARPTPDYDAIANSGSADDILRVVSKDLQASVSLVEKELTPERMKHLEEQIIPCSDQSPVTETPVEREAAYSNDAGVEPSAVKKSAPEEVAASPQRSVLSADQQKALDGLIDYFQFDGPGEGGHSSTTYRTRRNVNKADDPFVRRLADLLISTLNSFGPDTQSRVLLEILSADEETIDGKVLFYVRAKVAFPRQNLNPTVKVCNAMIDATKPDSPRVLKSFCSIIRESRMLGGRKPLALDSPQLLQLIDQALDKIETESSYDSKLKVLNVLSADTQVVSGTLTRLSVELGFTDCPKSDYVDISQCAIQTERGSTICKIHSLSQPWMKSNTITFKCIDAPILKSKKETVTGGITEGDVNDPKIVELAKETLQHYELTSESDNRLKIMKIHSVSKQLVSGILTKIKYDAAFTKCKKNDTLLSLEECEFSDHSPNQKCYAEVWDQPWIKGARKVTVTCAEDSIKIKNKNAATKRTKRDTCGIPGGVCEKDASDPEYFKLAQEALEHLERQTASEYRQRVFKVTKATKQVVAGSLVKLDFEVGFTNCLRNVSESNVESKCEMLKDRPIRNCKGKIWNRPWLKDGKQITVSCDGDISHRNKREATQITSEKYYTEFKMDSVNYIEPRTRGLPIITTEQFGLEDMMLAQRAVNILNSRLTDGNTMKLVKVRSLKRGLNNAFLQIHFDVAFTSCLVLESVNPSECDPLEGVPVRRCHSKIYKRRRGPHSLGTNINVFCEEGTPSIQQLLKDLNWVEVTNADKLEHRKQAQLSLEKLTDTVYKMKALKVMSVSESETQDSAKNIIFLAAYTNCSLNHPIAQLSECKVLKRKTIRLCQTEIWTRGYMESTIQCDTLKRDKRSGSGIDASNHTKEQYEKLAKESLLQLEWSSDNDSRQKVVNVQKTEELPGNVTRIEFDVAFTKCSKYEKVEDVSTCEPLVNSPHRRCTSHVWKRNWLKHGRAIDANCVARDDLEVEDYDTALQLAELSLKHVEARYIHPSKQNLVRIMSMDQQVISGIHYRLRFEVGFTDCLVFDDSPDCKFTSAYGPNKFCKANVWLRPWLNQPPNVKVTCKVDNDTLVPDEVYHHLQAERLFHRFLTKHPRSYADDNEERARRFNVFKENVKRIHLLNVREMGTAKYGVTQFADLTYEEFRKKHTGLRPDLKSGNVVPMPMAVIPKKALPESFDWRQKGAVTPVKNQGSCGSCWAFSVTGNIEGQYKIVSNHLVSLSEQELVDCDKLDEGCNGGLPDNAYRAIEQLGGLELESAYPYDADDETCKYDKKRIAVTVRGAVNISSSEPDMASWLVANGPISIGINANAMQFYMGGVSHPWKMLCNPKNLDHGVLIVGYGVKNYPLFHKTLPYWIVKNSWGPSWGEQGYYRVYRGDGTCGVNQMASSAVVNPPDYGEQFDAVLA